ncbi:MAG: ankyrin repeat domain-containing protein [Cocleimonas sp.]|nr:ankyrin repeat domain-containing protein [Cocleimonas sp.]
MNIQNRLNTVKKGLFLACLTPLISAGSYATANVLELSQDEMSYIIEGKISKVQEERRSAMAVRKAAMEQAESTSDSVVVIRKANMERPAPQPRAKPMILRGSRQNVQRSQYKAPVAPAPVHRIVRPAPVPANLPAWRRPVSHTMTRGSQDAIFAAAKTNNLRLVKQLITEGADVNYRNFNGETALHIAASLGNMAMVQYLLAHGGQLHSRTAKQWQPIHHSIRFDRAIVANYLLSRGASMRTKTSDGLTALDLAKASKNQRIKSIAWKYSKK